MHGALTPGTLDDITVDELCEAFVEVKYASVVGILICVPKQIAAQIITTTEIAVTARMTCRTCNRHLRLLSIKDVTSCLYSTIKIIFIIALFVKK